MFHMIVPQLFDRHQAGTGAEFKVWLQVHWSSQNISCRFAAWYRLPATLALFVCGIVIHCCIYITSILSIPR